MANKKELPKELPNVNSDLTIVFIKEWQHPHGTLKQIGNELIVTNEYGMELVAEGYAEIKTT